MEAKIINLILHHYQLSNGRPQYAGEELQDRYLT